MCAAHQHHSELKLPIIRIKTVKYWLWQSIKSTNHNCEICIWRERERDQRRIISSQGKFKLLMDFLRRIPTDCHESGFLKREGEACVKPGAFMFDYTRGNSLWSHMGIKSQNQKSASRVLEKRSTKSEGSRKAHIWIPSYRAARWIAREQCWCTELRPVGLVYVTIGTQVGTTFSKPFLQFAHI